jgi:hypothetical protein
MKLSEQALTCLMMALQKSLMEQSDIVPLLLDFNFLEEGGELFVDNPPTSVQIQTDEIDLSNA